MDGRRGESYCDTAANWELRTANFVILTFTIIFQVNVTLPVALDRQPSSVFLFSPKQCLFLFLLQIIGKVGSQFAPVLDIFRIDLYQSFLCYLKASLDTEKELIMNRF